MSLYADLEPMIRHYGYATVGIGLLLEHFGLPLPGETLLIAASVLAARGSLDIALLLVVAWAGATLGNMVGFAIGRSGGRPLVHRYGGRVGITEAHIKEVEAFFARYGDWVIVGARFVVVMRQLSGIVAGTLEMSWTRFLIFNTVGAALWVLWWGLLAYEIGNRVFEFVHGLNGAEYLLLALAAALAIALGTRAWRRRVLLNAAAEARRHESPTSIE